MKDTSFQKAPTSREIAAVAGVSHVTVSKALRDDPKISTKTRERVREIATSMGYRPNPLVSAYMASLRDHRRQSIRAAIAWLNGFTQETSWVDNPHLLEYLQGARRRAEDLGYHLDEFWLRAYSPERLNTILTTRNIFGVIVPDAIDVSRYPELNWNQWSICACLGRARSINIHQILLNTKDNFDLAIQRLREKGYKRIGVAAACSEPPQISILHACVHAYHSWIPKKEVVKPILTMDGLEHHREEFIRWYGQHQPDVILCNNRHIYHFLSAANVRVPHDVGLVHFAGGIDVADWTRVTSNAAEIGAAAVESVVARLNRNERGISLYHRSTLISGEWHDGRTLSPASPLKTDPQKASQKSR